MKAVHLKESLEKKESFFFLIIKMIFKIIFKNESFFHGKNETF